MSGWCQAASARWPTVLITIIVLFQLAVLYVRLNPAVFQAPVGKILGQPRRDLGVRQGLFTRAAHIALSSTFVDK